MTSDQREQFCCEYEPCGHYAQGGSLYCSPCCQELDEAVIRERQQAEHVASEHVAPKPDGITTATGVQFEPTDPPDVIHINGHEYRRYVAPQPPVEPDKPDHWPMQRDFDRAIDSALRLRACVLKQRQLRESIDWQRCEMFSSDPPLRPPCPFNEELDGVEDAARELPDRWCEPCRENYALRGELITERKRQSGLLRGFVNAARVWEKRYV